MNLKKLIPVFLLAVVSFTLLKGALDHRPPTIIPTPTPVVERKLVTLSIDYGNNNKFSSDREFSASQSAFTLLQQVTSQQSLPFSYKQYPFGNLVESINNVKNSPSQVWIYFVNSKSPDIGADQYWVQPGDLVEWKYIKPQ